MIERVEAAMHTLVFAVHQPQAWLMFYFSDKCDWRAAKAGGCDYRLTRCRRSRKGQFIVVTACKYIVKPHFYIKQCFCPIKTAT